MIESLLTVWRRFDIMPFLWVFRNGSWAIPVATPRCKLGNNQRGRTETYGDSKVLGTAPEATPP